eukprot:6176561-Pleurochrysis_carterae.AAC.1
MPRPLDARSVPHRLPSLPLRCPVYVQLSTKVPGRGCTYARAVTDGCALCLTRSFPIVLEASLRFRVCASQLRRHGAGDRAGRRTVQDARTFRA